MAMTMSDNMPASNDWFQFYQQPQDFHGVPSSSISDATAVTTVVSTAGVTTSSSPLIPMLNSTSSAASTSTTTHLSPEGRVAKPIRRRSRASRRTPTTLLNTDTTNFRAMVQQFTGGPSAPFAPTPSSSGLASLGFGFGLGPRQAHISPTGGLMVGPPPAGYHLQPQQQPQIFQQQNLAFNTEGGDQSRFFQRLQSNSNNNNNNNPRASNNATDLGIGGFVMDHGSLGRFFPSTS
ncbi:VQ motif-containing protein 22-like [Prosopis cineraria]|uniref:VQ motif-containing protein 22-like n=1 Tax=Prosopis cineraria TaxID=364024 RepID=UPI00240EF3B1|nr:VQ motif-containing protein 22-like [Prosopis cineraria]